jgi:restriction system protein
MLVRFDSQIKQKGNLQPSGVLGGRLGFLTGLMAFMLISWLVYRYITQPAWLQQLPAILTELLFLIEAASAITLAILVGVILWQQQAQTRQLSVLTVEEMHALSPTAFEKYVAGLFRMKGYRVRHRGRRGDRGVDLELTHPGGRKAIVQCKRYLRPIGPDVVRELFGTLVHERVHHAFLVTTADISTAAREWAAYKPLTLIDGKTVVQIASSLQKKSES